MPPSGRALPRWLAAAVLLVGVGCAAPEEPRGRVLLVGIDGAAPGAVEKLLAEGRLPQLAALAADGTWGPLRSQRPLYSPRIWTTAATGKLPEKHGITSFSWADGDGVRHLFNSHQRRVHALWNIASRAGLRVGVVNWWTTQPPERIDGVMVSDHVFPEEIDQLGEYLGARAERLGPTVWPPAWRERVAGLLAGGGRPIALPDPFAAGGLPEQVDADYLSRRFAFDESLVRVALAIEAELSPEVLLVLLPAVDKASHYLWSYLVPGAEAPPEASDPERAAAAEALRVTYAAADALVGRLAERYGPDDLVLVVSDHGFESGGRPFGLAGIHRGAAASDGVVFARGRGVERGAPTGSAGIVDLTPTILAWLGLPLGEDMDGAPLDFVDVGETRRVATHDIGAIEREGEASSDAERRLLEELRSLGYTE